jgi:hypothetical protein
VYNQSDTPR